MTNLNEITYVDWQCKLNGIGGVAEGVEDINQCIAIILQTQKGIKYVDYPINIAKANIIRETIDAINLWETRVKVNKTEVEINGSTILIKVEWTLAKGKTSGAVEVTL